MSLKGAQKLKSYCGRETTTEIKYSRDNPCRGKAAKDFLVWARRGSDQAAQGYSRKSLVRAACWHDTGEADS